MRVLPTPDRGAPLDVDYIYAIADTVNQIVANLSTRSSTLSTVDNGTNKREVSTQSLRIYAKTQQAKVGAVDAGKSEAWSINFNPPFKYPPVVTATIVNNNQSTAGNDVTVIIKNTTTGNVSGEILFHRSGTIDVSMNIVAIGVNE